MSPSAATTREGRAAFERGVRASWAGNMRQLPVAVCLIGVRGFMKQSVVMGTQRHGRSPRSSLGEYFPLKPVGEVLPSTQLGERGEKSRKCENHAGSLERTCRYYVDKLHKGHFSDKNVSEAR